jgi:phospholipid/cholesterol/gamma-HCH transport system substrate-binding protein
METRANHVLIGAFTILAVAAAMLFGLWLAKDHRGADLSQYDVVFNEPVMGLSEGSSVQFSGIKVGDVVTLTLDQTDPKKVHARIRVNESTPIRQDTQARLTLTGITGTSIIQLSGGSPHSPTLVAPAGKIPVIIASPSPLAQLASNGEDLMGNLNEVLRGARTLLSAQNTERASQTLEHLEATTGALANQRDDMHKMVLTFTETAREANQALKSANLLLMRTDKMVAGHGDAILDNTKQLTASLARVSDNIDRLLSNNGGAVSQGLASTAELGPALRELRETLASLRQITRRLDENPSDYLLGRDRNREFSP